MKKNTKESRTLRVLKRIINIRAWFDWERMKTFFSYLFNGFKKFLVPQEKEASESFNEAKMRLNLSDNELIARQKGLLRLSILMVVIAILVFMYLIYQLILGNILSSLLSLIVIGIALVLAFRYHFWYFQIKERKLGCTFREWFKQGLMGEKR